MVLFEMSPFHPFYHSPATRRGGCRRGVPGDNYRWMGHPAMELVLPVAASDIFSRRSNIFNNNHINKLRQEVTEEGARFTLPLEGFDVSGLEVKVEDGALKIEARKEEKNEKGETVATRMMRQVVSLPEGCDKDAVETSFEKNGALAISISRKAKSIETEMTPEVTKESQQTQELPQDATQENQEVTQEITGENQENQDTEEELRVLGIIPVMGFRPEELSVKIIKDGKAFEVLGRHEDPATGHLGRLSRVYPIPADVEAEKIEARMSKDGSELRVVVPLALKKLKKLEAEPEKDIPIEMD